MDAILCKPCKQYQSHSCRIVTVINTLYSTVPSNFTMLFSATQYNIEIEAYQPLPPDTHLFNMTLYINNNTLVDQFPGNTVFFNIYHGLAFGFEGDGPTSESSVSNPAVLNTIELSVVTSTFHFGLHSTTITALVISSLDILTTSINVSVNVQYICTGNECFNGGTCISDNNEIFTCICVTGFYASRCERIVGELNNISWQKILSAICHNCYVTRLSV